MASLSTSERSAIIALTNQYIALRGSEYHELELAGVNTDTTDELRSRIHTVRLLKKHTLLADATPHLTEDEVDALYYRLIAWTGINVKGTIPSSGTVHVVPAGPTVVTTPFPGNTGDLNNNCPLPAFFTIGTGTGDCAWFDGIDLQFNIEQLRITALENANHIPASLFDANTILKADTDNTPVALTIVEDRIVGRKTGGSITALTGQDVLDIMGITASPAEINILDGAAITTAELNFLVGATSNIQVQIDNIISTTQPLAPVLTAWAAFDTDGILVQTATATFTGRTLKSTNATIVFTDPNGVAGDPDIELPSIITPGSFTQADITVDAFGRITVAANGTPTSVVDATASVKGITKLSADGSPITNPIAVGTLDTDFVTLTDGSNADALHVHTSSGVTDFGAAVVALAIPVAEKGTANGVAELDSGGKVPTAQIPDISKITVDVVADLTAHLALTAVRQQGDFVIRTDESLTYIRKDTSVGDITDYQEIFARVRDLVSSSSIDVAETPTGTFTPFIKLLGVLGTMLADTSITNVKIVNKTILPAKLTGTASTVWYVDSSSDIVEVDFAAESGNVWTSNGTSMAFATPSGTIGGSGTTNQVAKFTAASTIGDSLIFDNGTIVIVNATTAIGGGHRLQVSKGALGGTPGNTNAIVSALFENSNTAGNAITIAGKSTGVARIYFGKETDINFARFEYEFTTDNFCFAPAGQNNAFVITVDSNIGINTNTFGTNAENLIAINASVAPTTFPVNTIHIAAIDHAGGGTRTFHMFNEEGDAIKLFKGAALTAADNTAINSVYDATEEAVLNNVRTRVNELESRLQAFVLLT